MQEPNWAAAAAVLGEHSMTAVHRKILEWHRVDAAAAAGMAVGGSECLMMGVL